MPETADDLPRRRSTDGGRTDHDLLLQIAGDVQAMRTDVRDQAVRIRALEHWRQEHSVEAAVQIQRIDALRSGDGEHDHAIDALESWRDEMRGAWAGVKFGLVVVGSMSGLSVILEILRLIGMLH